MAPQQIDSLMPSLARGSDVLALLNQRMRQMRPHFATNYFKNRGFPSRIPPPSTEGLYFGVSFISNSIDGFGIQIGLLRYSRAAIILILVYFLRGLNLWFLHAHKVPRNLPSLQRHIHRCTRRVFSVAASFLTRVLNGRDESSAMRISPFPNWEISRLGGCLLSGV